MVICGARRRKHSGHRRLSKNTPDYHMAHAWKTQTCAYSSRRVLWCDSCAALIRADVLRSPRQARSRRYSWSKKVLGPLTLIVKSMKLPYEASTWKSNTHAKGILKNSVKRSDFCISKREDGMWRRCELGLISKKTFSKNVSLFLFFRVSSSLQKGF